MSTKSPLFFPELPGVEIKALLYMESWREAACLALDTPYAC